MRLKRLHIRYYPPGIFLDYEKGGQLRTKSIDLLNLTPETDVNELLSDIRAAEPLITSSCAEQVKVLICRLQEKVGQKDDRKFYLFRTLQAHILPLTNVAFNKSGSSFITGSYDRTCKIWDTASGEELHTLEGHRNVVYAIAFNNPYGKVHILTGHRGEISCVQFNWDCSLIVTASLDKTCKVWDTDSGQCLATLLGHNDEVLDVCFNSTGQLIATASADGTSRVFSAETFQCLCQLEGHNGEISKVCFNPQGSRVLTASVDKTARVWHVNTGACLQVLEGHSDEIFSCAFNYEGDTIITGSKDNTCRIWH
uniref:Dynein assembly factor with WD repeat domains 1 n=1 Tax=Sinocyclocheilus rhinocerous TaxID=307959 RepID=A0A673H5C0_9TELE